ncbi:MAG: NUDIX domain-containing protein, partial [Clostridia bacterium]|nr:NUDIX domain-containing protein [Clostridia bacterium]
MQKANKVIEVVAALIVRGDRFLACQRPPEKARGLLWEFVGGKVEAGESGPEALVRECREELDVV